MHVLERLVSVPPRSANGEQQEPMLVWKYIIYKYPKLWNNIEDLFYFSFFQSKTPKIILLLSYMIKNKQQILKLELEPAKCLIRNDLNHVWKWPFLKVHAGLICLTRQKGTKGKLCSFENISSKLPFFFFTWHHVRLCYVRESLSFTLPRLDVRQLWDRTPVLLSEFASRWLTESRHFLYCIFDRRHVVSLV